MIRVFLRIEIYPALTGPGWVWRLTEPRPGRTALLRRQGTVRTWWLAVAAAVFALYRYRKGVTQ